MSICSEGHKEIVYNSYNCPMCDMVEEIKTLKSEIEKLKNEADSDYAGTPAE